MTFRLDIFCYMFICTFVSSHGLVNPKMHTYQQNGLYDDVEEQTGSFPFLMPLVSPKTVRYIIIWVN